MSETTTTGVRLSALRTDPKVEREGVWRTFEDPVEFRLARSTGPHFQTVLEEEVERWKEENEGKTPKGEAMTRLQKRVYARAVVRDVRGVVDDDGNVIAYDADTIYGWFCDPGLHDLWTWVLIESSRRDGYQREAEAAELGNS